jgi:hypothetical protein
VAAAVAGLVQRARARRALVATAGAARGVTRIRASAGIGGHRGLMAAGVRSGTAYRQERGESSFIVDASRKRRVQIARSR